MLGINRHTGRLCLLASLFATCVLMSRLALLPEAPFQQLLALFFFGLAHWLFCLFCYGTVSVPPVAVRKAAPAKRTLQQFLHGCHMNRALTLEALCFGSFALAVITHAPAGLQRATQMAGLLYLFCHLFFSVFPSLS